MQPSFKPETEGTKKQTPSTTSPRTGRGPRPDESFFFFFFFCKSRIQDLLASRSFLQIMFTFFLLLFFHYNTLSRSFRSRPWPVSYYPLVRPPSLSSRPPPLLPGKKNNNNQTQIALLLRIHTTHQAHGEFQPLRLRDVFGGGLREEKKKDVEKLPRQWHPTLFLGRLFLPVGFKKK